MGDDPIVMPAPGPPRGPQRPPPTGYRDENEVYHPGPGSAGYEAHASACPACLPRLHNAIARGERWALAVRLKPRLLPGPDAGGTALVHARRGHHTLVALGAAVGGALGLLLPAAIVVPLLVAGVALALRGRCRCPNEKMIQSTQIVMETDAGQITAVKLSAAAKRGLRTGGKRIGITAERQVPETGSSSRR